WSCPQLLSCPVIAGLHTSTPADSVDMGEQAALAAVVAAGVPHRVIRHGPVRSLAEAAEARGVEPRDVVKTLVVRRGEDDYLFVLVPGDREISWPKLRALLGVSRMSMPDAAAAKDATGYERGTTAVPCVPIPCLVHVRVSRHWWGSR